MMTPNQHQDQLKHWKQYNQINITCCVIHNNGQEYNDYPSCNLIPGDIIILKTGDKIPDLLYVKTYKNQQHVTSYKQTISLQKIVTWYFA